MQAQARRCHLVNHRCGENVRARLGGDEANKLWFDLIVREGLKREEWQRLNAGIIWFDALSQNLSRSR